MIERLLVLVILFSFSLIIIPFSAYALDCPKGAYIGRDNQGNEVCRDIETNQIIDPETGLMFDSQTGGVIFNDEEIGYIAIGVFVVIIIIAGIAAASRKKSKSDSYKEVERKDFTFVTKERVKELQKGKCAKCERYPTHWEFDHIDTRGDNSIENCQGLCRDCHQKKTLDDNWSNRK